ncbi:MAG TPA: zinc-ribbon domain-containing protein [Candidatus Acidoferrales bacterium]|jgi:uncharacterized membrane protein|nr:zinc-ribbon domain-containing protein [Candidatus Acidoferrales bacterium]
MAHCTKCGAAMADNAAFCGSCGSAQAAAPSAAPVASPVAVAPAQSQMAENVAGFLCYLLVWVTGIIFFLIDKRPYVRFHAAQSIVIFGGLSVLHFAIGIFVGASFFMGGWTGLSFGWMLLSLIDLVGFILWILLMIKAYQGERFRVPIAADLAEKIFGKA